MQDYNLGPSVNIGAVGDKYDSTATYAVGDYCIKDDKLYVCNTAIETAEAWNASHWTDTTIADVLKTIPVVVDNLTTNDSTKALSAAQGKALNSKFTDMGSFSASTVTDFMTSVLSAMSNSNYPNGRYVVNATWQGQSVYVIVANKVSNTRIIGNATPQIQNGKDMIAFSLEGTTVNIYPIALTSNLASLQFIKVTKNVTIPANDFIDVDLSSFIPSGKNIFAISNVRLGNYCLPYISGTSYTWVEIINSSTRAIRIKNTATVWTNYEMTLVLFVA